jgi:hypothetical protein
MVYVSSPTASSLSTVEYKQRKCLTLHSFSANYGPRDLPDGQLLDYTGDPDPGNAVETSQVRMDCGQGYKPGWRVAINPVVVSCKL